MSQRGGQFIDALHTSWQFLRHLTRRFFRDGCQESAAALTYITLFALVPLLTLMFLMLSLVPAFQGLEADVQKLIFDNFLPESGSDVQQYLQEFTAQARTLSALGGIILIFTSYMMLANIENTFNKIWGTAGGRRGLSSFLLYWAILSLGPLLVGIGLSMNAYLISYKWLVAELDKLGLLAVMFRVLPLLFSWAAASLLFYAVPNCQVRVRYALVGGFVTTLLFELLKAVFGLIVANSSYHTMYGAFAIVPLLLLWIYLLWTLLLIGAELVRALETFKTAVQGYTYPNLVAALVILSEAWQRQQQGDAISDRDMLRAGIDQQHWQELRNLFIEKRVLVATTSGRYVLTRDLARMPISELVEMFGESFMTMPAESALSSLEQYGWFGGLNQMLGDFSAHSSAIMSKTVGELFDDNKGTETES